MGSSGRTGNRPRVAEVAKHDKGDEQQWDSKRHGRWDIRDRSGLHAWPRRYRGASSIRARGRPVSIVDFWRALRGAACRGCAISGHLSPDRP